MIGGGDWSSNRIIPDFIRAMEKKVPLEIRNPESVRPWQHVLEPLSGYLLLGARMSADPVRFAQAYNFGPSDDRELTVEDVVKQAQTIFGRGQYIFTDKLSERHEAGLLHLNISKAMSELGWKPKLNPEEAIGLTMEWYRDYRNDPFGITFKQVNEYFNGGH